MGAPLRRGAESRLMANVANSPVTWALAAARLPERLDGQRVLEVGDERGADAFAALGAAEFVSCEQPTETPDFEGGFQLIHCSAKLDTDLHPLSVFAWLWMMAAPGAVLLTGSTVLTDPAHSQFARFLPAEEPPSGHSRWIPGRLALRWMVEVSGFDDTRWLGETAAADDSGGVAGYVQATRGERGPALDLTRQPLGR